MQTTITHQWTFDQSPEDVWDYLTKPELLAQWLMPTNFEPVAGHAFEFRTNPIPALGLDGVFHCKVLEIVPVQKLRYSWQGGPGTGVVTLDTLVEWTLERTGGGTLLHLSHSGFMEENASIFNGMLNGWNKNVEKMEQRLKSYRDAHTNA